MDGREATRESLARARLELLDLTTRNRLLNTPRRSSRSTRLEIVDERADEVFRLLVTEGRTFQFLPASEEEPPTESASGPAEEPDAYDGLDTSATDMSDELAQPEADNENGESDLAARHADHRLQTTLKSEKLQSRLLRFYYDARTYEEEQGVNILFLAVGFLKWNEPKARERDLFAPLILVPVELDRRSARTRFVLRYDGDEIATNLSLQEKLRVDYGIALPDLPETESCRPEAYFEQVRDAVREQDGWEVLDHDIVLWFFSFAKFLMYRDLQPDLWPADRQLEQHPLIDGLLRSGLVPGPARMDDSRPLDEQLPVADTIHILDADSSQAAAIEEVRCGRNLVIQGPPGTGKSQTIANMIAAAVHDGRRILFMSEKMAALEVVKRRLDNLGLGGMCLELHSRKSQKRAVIRELERTIALGRPRRNTSPDGGAEALEEARAVLNRHVAFLHTPVEPSGFTVFEIQGKLVELRERDVATPDFTLPDADTWTAVRYRETTDRVQRWVIQAEPLGGVESHPWRGVGRLHWMPTDRDRLLRRLAAAVNHVDAARVAMESLASAFDVGVPANMAEAERLAAQATWAVSKPSLGGIPWEDPGWEDLEAVHGLVVAGGRAQDCRRELQGIIRDDAWQQPEPEWAGRVASAAAAFRRWSDSPWRWFKKEYRRARSLWKSVADLQAEPRPPRREISGYLQSFHDGLVAEAVIRADQEGPRRVSAAFGPHDRGVDSDFQALSEVVEWLRVAAEDEVPESVRRVAQSGASASTLPDLAKTALSSLDELVQHLQELVSTLELDFMQAFGTDHPNRVRWEDWRARLSMWIEHDEGLVQWAAYAAQRNDVVEAGLHELVRQFESGAVSLDQVEGQFQVAYFERLVQHILERHPSWATFDGRVHDQHVERFRRLDRESMARARIDVARAHFQGLCRAARAGDIGEAGVVRREIAKKIRHLPIRRLLARAGRAVQAIKPVFMMSPVSIAQFLEPGGLEFDLLVVDEASQVRPVDALGAIARCRQMVVVGDDRQLPPTRFFDRIAGEIDDADVDDDFRTADLESILGVCEARGMAPRMLRWHYRSRHHSLITVSNREFYDGGLIVIPSPEGRSADRGLRFQPVDGIFDRGGTATNRREAEAVADAVLQHAATCPDLTLGVGAFSVRQRDAILVEIEKRRRETPQTESFFNLDAAEPFFVKNLENIQGDERDVIFISVGYGRDAEGLFSMNLGPLSQEGGERRLNVLITRARRQCVVFASITDEDLDLTRTQARGTRALKTFLREARLGDQEAWRRPGNEPHTGALEPSVADALRDSGHEVHARVGVAGVLIDLAVVDPDEPGSYLLGIECDGIAYRDHRWARDRDRLRETVLRDRGWRLERIWSGDWFHRPQEQRERLESAVDASRTASDASVAAPAVPKLRRERRTAGEEAAGDERVVAYREADFDVDAETTGLHQVTTEALAEVVARIVEVEGPIHREEVARRIATLWDRKRAGGRIVEVVEEAIEHAGSEGVLVAVGGYLSLTAQETVPIRNREGVASSTLRKPEYLPPAEVRAALLHLAEVHFGASADELITATARTLGFRVTTQNLRVLLSDELAGLLAEGQLEDRFGHFYRC